MSLTATARSIDGTLRQDVLIDGRHRLTTDEPTHLGGEDTGPAPHELFPAALAACVSTTLVMYAAPGAGTSATSSSTSTTITARPRVDLKSTSVSPAS
jgi:uncharacterized OsmC-like protein